MSSTVPSVIAALFAGLAARPALADAVIEVGLPTVDMAGRRVLTIGGQDEPTVEEGSSDWGAIGRGRRHEDYSIRVYCAVLRGDADQLAAILDVFALQDELEAFVRSDPSLGGVIQVGEGAEPAASFTLELTGPALLAEHGGGRWAQLSTSVRVRAII